MASRIYLHVSWVNITDAKDFSSRVAADLNEIFSAKNADFALAA